LTLTRSRPKRSKCLGTCSLAAEKAVGLWKRRKEKEEGETSRRSIYVVMQKESEQMIPYEAEFDQTYLEMIRELMNEHHKENLVIRISGRIDKFLRREEAPYVEATLALWLSIITRFNLRLSVISKKEMDDLQRTARDSGDRNEVEAASRLYGLWSFVQDTLLEEGDKEKR